MQDLLFVTQRIPFPPIKGEKIRAWNFLRRFSEDYRVHLACFVDDPDDWQHRPVLEQVCASLNLVPLHKTVSKYSALSGLATGEALTLRYFHDRRMAAWIEETRASRDIRRVYVKSSGVAGYTMGPSWSRCRRVVDMADVDSEKWRQYAESKQWPGSWIYGREAQKMLEFERRVASAYDATVFVTEPEAALFRKVAPLTAGRTHSIDSGVDCDYFDPAGSYQRPYAQEIIPLLFTGTMDYWPNIDAVVWFAREVLPLLRQREPRIRFVIAGASPARQVAALAENDKAVTVTGRVPDMRPYLAHAAAVIAPLRIARGVQNKVLEGMAMARPVVATPMALEGINEAAAAQVVVADGPAAFAEAVMTALQPAVAERALRARELVRSRHSWDASYLRLRSLIESDDAASHTDLRQAG